MRLKVTFIAAEPVHLPVNYHHMLLGLIYSSMEDHNFSLFLHEKGYKYEKRMFKLFTFSRLFGKTFFNRTTKMLTFVGEFSFYISSVSMKFIDEMGNAFAKMPHVRLGSQCVQIKEILFFNQMIPEKRVYHIRMLSPMMAYSTFKSREGKATTHYFHPRDIMFNKHIAENLTKKYEAYYDKRPEGAWNIKPYNVSSRNKVVTRFKDTIINAWNGLYEVQTTKEMLQFAYQAGLGPKTSQGFGMFEVVST